MMTGVHHRKRVISTRTERIDKHDLDVRFDTVRYEEFLPHPEFETVLSSHEFYDAHITRNGKYIRIVWSWTGTPDNWTSASCGPLGHVRSSYQMMNDLRALPPEAIGTVKR